MKKTITDDPRNFLEKLYNNFQDEIFSEEDSGAVIDRYYAPDFTLVSDGISIDRERLIKHIRPVKKSVLSGTYEVLEAVTQGNRLAARLVIRAVMKQGAETENEVHMFCEMTDDGRFANINQITRSIKG
ncbi:nuclear transport factor 2 family protein [Streptomyces marokkonensis]|uniref:Nuclear transport factor 2 family protein n=1 Tax=Streptomyces marokkonensis TaxID=324855 RepID=A0ABW6QI77_9ACTN